MKEQTTGVYARKLADNGFITIAFGASYQGESTGEPRQVEPIYPNGGYQRGNRLSDDTSAGRQQPNRSHGNLSGGGYTAHAAIDARRIKAVGTVSAVNIGSMFRNGWGCRATLPVSPLRKQDAPEITYEAFHMAESFLTPPLEIVAGSVLESKWMSDDLYRRPASTRKNLYVVARANHMNLYNVRSTSMRLCRHWRPSSRPIFKFKRNAAARLLAVP